MGTQFPSSTQLCTCSLEEPYCPNFLASGLVSTPKSKPQSAWDHTATVRLARRLWVDASFSDTRPSRQIPCDFLGLER